MLLKLSGAAWLSVLIVFHLLLPSGHSTPLVRQSTAAPMFTDYTYKEHPLFTFPDYQTSRPKPVIMHKYYRFTTKNNRTVTKMRYMPRIATYTDDTGALPLTDLDALIVLPNRGNMPPSPSIAVEVHLNNPDDVAVPARAFVMLYGMDGAQFNEIKTGITSITGLSDCDTGNARYVHNSDYRYPLTGIRANGERLPTKAVAVECPVAAGMPLNIPTLNAITINGDIEPRRMMILFAKPEAGAPQAFDEQDMPLEASVQKFSNNVDLFDKPVPNTRCPAWLHDIHVVKSLDVGEPKYWKTWHPAIDSVYWCYYDHEHGAFPGSHFRPAFGYTAHHTFDNVTMASQDESHNGFKVYAWQLEDEGSSALQPKAIVLTLHAHLSRRRRFTTREHTVVFAAFTQGPGNTWKDLMLLHMKMDFGAAKVLTDTGSREKLANDDQQPIQDEADADNVIRGRKFLISASAFLGGFLTGNLNDGYEEWNGLLNTCSSSVTKWKGKDFGFEFDFINPQTAVDDAAVMSMLEADDDKVDGLRRRIEIREGGFKIAKEFCSFGSEPLTTTNGVFYTDTTLKYVRSGEGEWNARQFLSADFMSGTTDLHVKEGVIFPSDLWPSHMRYRPSDDPADNIETDNIEKAIDPKEN